MIWVQANTKASIAKVKVVLVVVGKVALEEVLEGVLGNEMCPSPPRS